MSKRNLKLPIGLPKMPGIPAATTPIKCAKRACGWTGLQAELVATPHQKFTFVKKLGCPTCGHGTFSYIQPKEVSAA